MEYEEEIRQEVRIALDQLTPETWGQRYYNDAAGRCCVIGKVRANVGESVFYGKWWGVSSSIKILTACMRANDSATSFKDMKKRVLAVIDDPTVRSGS
jgi:hypothetical protein